jgi:hypothetical protein
MARGFERLKDQAARDELLSAYLDDQLSAEDHAHLEARLAADSALRSELEMLRRTVALVRDLPPQPVPRNFILPQTAAPKARPEPVARRPRWLAPFLTAATAAVSLLFVAVLVGDLLLFDGGGVAQLAAPAAEGAAGTVPVEKEAEERAPQMFTVTDSPEVADATEAWSEPDEGEGTPLAMEVPGTPPPGVSTPPTVPTEVQEPRGEYAAPTSTPAEPSIPAAGGGEPPVESPIPTPSPAADEAADAAVPDRSPVPLPEPATGEPTERVLRDTESAPNGVGATEPLPSGRGDEDSVSYMSPWRAAEVALGVSALLLLVAAFWAWRARRR